MNAAGQAWLVANQKKFTPQHFIMIKNKMASMDDNQLAALSVVEVKDPTTMILITLFLGELGIQRFMLDDTGMGVLELLTCGLCFILWAVDLFTISKKTREYNYNQVLAFL